MTKVLVSFEDELLKQVDRAADAARLSRSAYLSQLVARALESLPGPGGRVSARRALSRLDDVFARHPRTDDSTAAIRAERDVR